VNETLSSLAERVRRQAADLAGGLSRTARGSATIAQERAVLRMLGVDGLDRAGLPLAATLAERYCGADAGRLSRGVLLPFVVAMLEYDVPARELALDGASGAIDLGLEAELLERPERLAAAEKRAAELLAEALVRFDANRTATRDMREVLGLAAEPRLGVALQATEVKAAAVEARRAVAQGADVVLVRVPASWEFAEARRQAGLETPGLFEPDPAKIAPGTRRMGPRRTAKAAQLEVEPVPVGSQRGLALLRRAVDDAAAGRGCYASLMTVSSAFAAPEQAVVAAFERIDYVAADPIREIVEDNVDPERALADHSFAHRLQARAGCNVAIGSGPLVLGTDVASGIPANAATLSGRAIALQALGVELALADGLPAERLVLGAIPDWAVGDGDPGSILLQGWLRRLVFADHRLVIQGPSGWLATQGREVALVSALAGASPAMVVEPGLPGDVATASMELRTADLAARAINSALGDGGLHGDAAVQADRTLRAAQAVLERLSAEGWETLLGPDGLGGDTERLGGSAAVQRAGGPTAASRLLKDLL
jgi:hypothetical protein